MSEEGFSAHCTAELEKLIPAESADNIRFAPLLWLNRNEAGIIAAAAKETVKEVLSS